MADLLLGDAGLLARALCNGRERTRGEREHANDDCRQNPIEPEHHGDRADQRQAIAERSLRGAHQRIADNGDVIGEARHEAADILAREAGEIDAHQLGEHAALQVAQNLERQALRHDRLRPHAGGANQNNRHGHNRHQRDLIQITGLDAVGGELQNPRVGRRRRRDDDKHRRQRQEVDFVAPDVLAPEPIEDGASLHALITWTAGALAGKLADRVSAFAGEAPALQEGAITSRLRDRSRDRAGGGRG